MKGRTAILSILLIVGCEDRKPPLSDVGSSAPLANSSATNNVAIRTPDTDRNAAAELDGEIRGKVFRPDRILLDGDLLRFFKGNEHFAEQEIRFQLPVPEGERLSGREWKIGGQYGEPGITILSRVGGVPEQTIINGPEYEMKLSFAKQSPTSVIGVVDIRLKYLDKTWLRGPFTAEYRKSPTAPLDENDAPFIQGKISLNGNDRVWDLSVGFVGIGTDGKPHSNSAGFPLNVGQGASVVNSMHVPQITSLHNHVSSGLIFRHVKVPPGDYLVFVRRGEVMFDLKRVALKAADQMNVNLSVDISKSGEVQFSLPNSNLAHPLALVPIGVDMPDLGLDAHLFFTVARPKAGETRTIVRGIPAGKYRAIYGKSSADVEVVAGKPSEVTLSDPK